MLSFLHFDCGSWPMNSSPCCDWMFPIAMRSQVLRSSIEMLVSRARFCWSAALNALKVCSDVPVPFARLSAGSLVSFLASFSFRSHDTLVRLVAPSAWLSTFQSFSSNGCLLRSDVLADWAWSFVCFAEREPASGCASTDWWFYCVRCPLCYDLSRSMVLYCHLKAVQMLVASLISSLSSKGWRLSCLMLCGRSYICYCRSSNKQLFRWSFFFRGGETLLCLGTRRRQRLVFSDFSSWSLSAFDSSRWVVASDICKALKQLKLRHLPFWNRSPF